MERKYSFGAADKYKTPPHSIEAEQAVLGGLIINNDSWDKVVDKLSEENFYKKEHKLIYKSITALAKDGQPFDTITITEWLGQHKQLEEVGGLSYIGSIANNTSSSANIGFYANIVYDRYVMRELVALGSDMVESATNPSGRTTQDILDEAEKKVFQIAEKGSKESGPEKISTVVSRTLDKIEKLFHEKSAITGVSTGFKSIDEMTSGLHPGELIIVAGRPAMGKTTFAMNIAENAAITTDKPVLVFSMEMPAEQLTMRILSSLGRIDQHRLRTGQLLDEDWPRISSTVGMMSKTKLLIDETPALSPMEMRARARRVAREHDGISLIVVDYLQLMRGSTGSDNRAAEISEISRSLKALSKELNVPVIALSQLNRGLEQRINKRPIMSDLRESGAIEQDADLIVFIYRDEVYNEDSEDKGTAEIIIGKHRNGPTGVSRLTFLGQYTRFENFTSNQQAPQPFD